LATIKLIDDIQDSTDSKAIEAAYLWMERIPALFISERSKQIQIGISEVGMDCKKCIARKLAMTPRNPDGAWYPFIGTAVHDALEHGFKERWPVDYLLENRLHVHSYKDLELSGSCDMYALTGVVNDWKVVGKTALADAARGKIKDQYRVQAMLYGYGWVQKGYEVTHVSLTFLPREGKLEDAQVVLLRYNQALALESLAQLESMIDAAELAGWEQVIERAPKAGFCFSCRRYEQTDNDISLLI